MIQTALERAYRRLGPRYPRAGLEAHLALEYPATVIGVAGLALFVRNVIEISAGEFVRIVLIGCALFFIYNLAYIRVALGLLRPLTSWLEGERDRAATIEAWRACASFPREMLRREWFALVPGALSWLGFLVFAGYVTWELELSAYTVVPLYVGISVFAAYMISLHFFATERVLRPVLDDLASRVTDEPDLYAPGIPLRARLLAALPAINVITGVIAYGVASERSDFDELALAVLVSVAIAATISLTLTLMLSNSVTDPLAALRDATTRVGQGDFTARIPIVTTDETGALARSFNQMAAGLEERERIRDALGTYVDREVAEHILREGTNLAGEEVEVTMMFIDIRNFTGFAERFSAPEVVATINRLFERLVPIIHAHKGHVDKFVGDGLLAVFGAPRRQEDHADQAVAAALEIERAVEEEFGGELGIGVGLNSGTVVAGNVGGAGRLEFSVIGDAVNVAARVESATRQTGDTILITERTRKLLRDSDVLLAERPNLALKGKREPVMLYAPSVDSARGPDERGSIAAPSRRSGD